jgi:Rps23 Pro-64 3,4-dihydroxylase Tpa1-like proline 4-hydroxylase
MKIESKNLFSLEEVDKILTYVKEWQDTNIQVRLGTDYSKSGGVMKSFKVTWNETNRWVQDKIIDWVNTLPEVRKTDKSDTIECYFRRYEVGDFFIKHDDHIHNGDRRVYTLGIQLSESKSFLGGALKFYLQDQEYTMPYEKGRAYVFDSSIPHSVDVITEGSRETMMFFIGESNIKREIKGLI